MISVSGKDLWGIFTSGRDVFRVYCNGNMVYPSLYYEQENGKYYYVAWNPYNIDDGTFVMGGETHFFGDMEFGMYSYRFLSSRFITINSQVSHYYMDNSAFTGNSEIEYVETNLQEIGQAAFKSCTALKKVTALKCRGLLGRGVGGHNGYQQTFRDCTSLLSVYLPICSMVGYEAFTGCTNLRDVNLDAARAVGENTFANCVNLPEIRLPSCSVVDNQAFYNCTSLSVVDLPVCSRINGSAFRSCSSLSSLYLGYSGVCLFGTDCFRDTPIQNGSGSVLVPLELVSDYKDAYPYLSSHIFPIPHE